MKQYEFGVGIKICNGCKQEKDFSFFSITKPGQGDRFNLYSKCKKCRAAIDNEWHRKNPLRSKANNRRFYRENTEYAKDQARIWREANKAKHAENNRRWKKENAAKNAMKQMARLAMKLAATPNWLSAIEQAQIQEFFDVSVARTVQTGVKRNVDHIFPLRGENSCGLNVPWNMRVITQFENISKKNRFPKEFSEMDWAA